MSVSEIFVELQGFLAAEQDIREEIRKVVQSLEQTAREILTLLQGVHQGAGFQDIPKRCLKAREYFGTVKTHLMSLKTKFPAEQYYRFHEHWRFVLQRLVFLAAFVVYLESETLVTREAVTEILGIEPDREKGFHLDVEDYLSGILILASELKGREGEKERNISVWLLLVHPLLGTGPCWELARNPGMCPDRESNRDLLVRRPVLSPLSYTSQVNNLNNFKALFKRYPFTSSYTNYESLFNYITIPFTRIFMRPHCLDIFNLVFILEINTFVFNGEFKYYLNLFTLSPKLVPN
ncbi:translin isoform X1 [Artibeus jamaicensis]|uniref:translin isoform X1 n=1 Tax=Artibeus jamaicensis TaxID=9417 RepID=UPI00235AB283|nr:translin isoform X1 [Artibeus jamaicensis]